ncbi:MAG TPA: hypothetical protein VLA96_06675 [Terriglobales bacterium]|nr:hypothetical protein [Terriglobales bacterium]
MKREEFGHAPVQEGPARPEANLVPPVRRLPDDAARYEERSERRGTYHASEPAPSFLGLGSAEYEKPEREISWRFWALMLLLLGVVALFGMQWRAGRLRASQPEPAKPAATQPAEEPAVRNEPAAPEETQAQPASGAESDKTAKPATEAPKSEEVKPKGKSDAAAQPEEPRSESDSAEPEQPKSEEQKPETRAAAREFSDAVVKQADSFIAAGQCNEALRALRGAGENPKAMTKMGAMYLTGTCVEPDRVTAYAWFSQAFAADPHNLRLESTRRSVWSQMSDEERAKVEAGVKAR